jgi:hypothetical protein
LAFEYLDGFQVSVRCSQVFYDAGDLFVGDAHLFVKRHKVVCVCGPFYLSLSAGDTFNIADIAKQLSVSPSPQILLMYCSFTVPKNGSFEG